MKLNLGCGGLILPGYINCDKYDKRADVECDAISLPFQDNSVEEIVSYHLIEHFDYWEATVVVKEWYRVMEPGGKLWIETPDLLACCVSFVNSGYAGRVELYGQFFAQPWIDGQIHKFMYTEEQLTLLLDHCGFRDISRNSAQRYIGIEHLMLGMEAFK